MLPTNYDPEQGDECSIFILHPRWKLHCLCFTQEENSAVKWPYKHFWQLPSMFISQDYFWDNSCLCLLFVSIHTQIIWFAVSASQTKDQNEGGGQWRERETEREMERDGDREGESECLLTGLFLICTEEESDTFLYPQADPWVCCSNFVREVSYWIERCRLIF